MGEELRHIETPLVNNEDSTMEVIFKEDPNQVENIHEELEE